jgi:hypothetical protein
MGRISYAGSDRATLVSIGMCVTLLLLLLGQSLTTWANSIPAHWQYQPTPVTQISAYVGHEPKVGPASRFLALDDTVQVEIIEFPGNDVSHARIFLGPTLFGSGASTVPATLRFNDPEHTGHLDMIIQVAGISEVFQNKHGTFEHAFQGNG